KIGKDAFAYTEIYDNSDNWTDGVLYIGNHLIKFNNEQNGSYTVKEGTVNISDYAFESAAISEIVLPDTVVSVGDYAFNLCDGINSVIFCGNEEKWNSVSIGEGNESLTGATIRLFYTVDSGNCGDNLTWTLDNEGLLTVSGTGDMTSWSEVTAIPWYGYRESIKTVIIEENVTGIGTSAFYGCSRMTEISLPDTLKTIGDSAFMECCSLKEITIPYGVTHIGYQAFDGCDALEAIYTDSENTMYSSDENGVLFNKEKTTLEKYPAGSKTAEYAVADGVAYISSCAFADCGNLTHISLSDSVTEIGEYAFSECGSLTTVSLGKGITDIGAHAFENCVNITGITIPDSAKTIGEGAFAGCDGMNIVNIGNGIASIGENAFDGCVNIAEVYYNGYKEQWSTVSVEAGNESLTGAVIHFARPGGVCGESLTWELAEDGTLIISGTGAMTNWSSAASLPWYEYISEITSVEIKEGVTSIGHYAFCAHNKLKSISIADSVTSIGNSSFNSCTSLKNIVIPKNVETIGWSAFYNCNQMTEVTMYNSLTSIGQSAFNKCSILETVYFYGNEAQWSAIEIGATNVPITAQAKIVYYVEDTNGKFGDNITWSLDKNGTLTLSGTGAMPVISAATEVPWYEYVSSVRKVVVESGITDIGAYVFEGHGYVSDVVIGDTVTKLGNRAFMKCTSIKSVTLPASVTTLGGSVFYGCTALANITIGSGLKAVGVSSFNSCSALKYVYYYGTADSWKTITITSSNTSLTNATRTYVSSGSAGVSGTCGENLVWTFDGKETLTVSGTGAMTSWSAAAATPWYDLRNRVTKIVIENGVTTIGSYAFCAFASLKDITIPDSVTSMGNSTFNSCTALESITIPSSITSIGWSVFYNCSSLDNVTMYNSITDIGASAFYRCSNLKTVYFYGTENEWNNIVRGTNNEPLSIATLQLLGDDDGTYTLSASAYVAGGNIVIKAKTDKLITDQHLHVALYSSSSKLVDYILVPMDEAFDRVNVVFKDNSEAAYAKVFLWETLTSLAPVTQAVSVEIPR
ncbi:MAG: leucine-rich repeat domain-containing protein, partial [Clostridia bacterium]|nr:leucine-rich repeat domain-containing protein [Clostridia bacterium]